MWKILPVFSEGPSPPIMESIFVSSRSPSWQLKNFNMERSRDMGFFAFLKELIKALDSSPLSFPS